MRIIPKTLQGVWDLAPMSGEEIASLEATLKLLELSDPNNLYSIRTYLKKVIRAARLNLNDGDVKWSE